MKLVDGAGTATLGHEMNFSIEGTPNSSQVGGAHVPEGFMERGCLLALDYLLSDLNMLENKHPCSLSHFYSKSVKLFFDHFKS